MSLTVAELVAKVSADTGNFESGMSRVRGSLASAHGEVGRTESGFASFARTAMAFVAGQVIYKGMTMAVQGLKQFGSEVVLSKARVDEMTIVLQNLARVNGISMAAVNQQVSGIRALHIEYGVAQNVVAQMIRSQIDVAKATDLARVAQDAAVISGQNSSDVLQQIIYGITTRQTEMLRTAGIQVNIDAAERQYAASIGKTVTQLTEQEKTQATLNAVLAEGAKYQGTYETAMQSAGKQMRSIKTDMNDLMVSMGGPFQAGFGTVVKTIRDTIHELTAAFGGGGALAGLLNSMGATFTAFGNSFASSFPAIIEAAAPVLATLTNDILKVAGALLEVLGPAFQQLGPFISAALDAFTQLLLPLMPLIPTLAQIAGSFVQLFTDIMVAAQPVVEALVPIVDMIGKTLVEAFDALEPSLREALKILGGAFADVIKALAPALPPLAKAVVDLVKAFSPVLVVVAKALAQHLRAIAPELPGLVKGFTEILIALTPLLPQLIQLIQLGLLPLRLYSLEIRIYLAALGVALRLAATAIRFIVDVVREVPGAFVTAGKAIADFFMAIPGAVTTALSAMGAFFTNVGSWFASLGPTILAALDTFFTQMVPAGAKVIGNFLLGLLQALPSVLEFFLLLPARLLVAVIGWSAILIPKGVEMLAGFLVGLAKKVPDVINFFVTLPSRIIAWIGNTVPTLVQKAWDLIWGFVQALGQKERDIAHWLITLPGKMLGWIGNTASTLYSKGVDLLNGLWSGMQAAVNQIWYWVRGLAGSIASWFGDVGGILYNAGKQIISGLWNGMKDAIGAVKDWLGSLPGKIISWKPIATDHLILQPAGRAIMRGLNIGLQQGADDVMRTLQRIGPQIQGGMPALSMVAGGVGARGTSVGSSAPVVFNITVQGSVLSERELGDVVNQQLFRLQRNGVATPWGRTA